MLARLSAFAIWALVAATAVFWGLRLFVSAPAAPAYTVAVGDAATVRGDLTRLLGSAPAVPVSAAAAPEASSRFRLFGIVAPKGGSSESTASGRGVALIAVDGKMPKAYPVGSQIDGDLVLQTVSLRTVSIAAGKGAPSITLELPRPLPAATGALSSAPIGGLPGAATGGAPAGVVPPFVPQPVTPQVFQPVPVLAPSANATAVPMRPEVGSPTQ